VAIQLKILGFLCMTGTKILGKTLWSPSYFSGSCGGASSDRVLQYIEGQKSPE
jgi:REP element-mobilizing transposase RayT